MKLVSFSKLGSKRATNHNRRHYHVGDKNDETDLLLNPSNCNQHMIDTMAMEIEQLLTKVKFTVLFIKLFKNLLSVVLYKNKTYKK